MKTISVIFSFLLLFVMYTVQGEPAPIKYGKINIADLEMKVYNLDTTAEAVILCDYGEYNPSLFEFTRLIRIKILRKEGFGFVNRVFNVTGSSAIKGCTYNLENGAIVESKLKNESIYKEVVYEDHYRYRITMPDVKVGSVVDIQYSFPLLPNEWRFQDEIPVCWSELRIDDSPYINFQKVFFGFVPLYITEPGRWVAKDMPALHPEPFMNSLTNYLSKVEIEISNITYPGYYKSFTTSWEAVNTYLLDHRYFGDNLGMALFLNEDAKTIEERKLSDMDKMKAACNLIKQKVKWDEAESLYTSSEISYVYKKGSGNSADLNLMLVALLKKLGFEAFPIALSTRENGIISPSFPTIDKLNYVVAGVRFNGKDYVFDATEPYLQPGMLPFRALNGRGRIISTKYSDWIDLSPVMGQKEAVFCNMKLNETGEITGTITYTDSDYEAYYFRKNFKSFNSQDEYIKELESAIPGLTVNSSSFENVDSLHKPVNELYEVSLSNYTDIIGDMISISPMLMERKESNPFKMEARKYPIDYGHPMKSRYVISITIPEEYEVVEMPKAINLVLPEKSGSFLYQSKLVGKTIQLMSTFEINKTVFVESEYQLVKEFYNQVIAKQLEVIMLKKKT